LIKGFYLVTLFECAFERTEKIRVITLKDFTENLILQSINLCKQKLRSSRRALSSQSGGRGFDPHPMRNRSGVKAMPGLIPAPNSGSL